MYELSAALFTAVNQGNLYISDVPKNTSYWQRMNAHFQ